MKSIRIRIKEEITSSIEDYMRANLLEYVGVGATPDYK